MSDTPETDAEHTQFAMGGFTLDFCRKLERERDKARNLVQSGIRAQASLNEALDKTLYDLRIAREEAAQWHNKAQQTTDVRLRDALIERENMWKTLIDIKKQNAKLRDIAERAVELAVQCNDGPCERDAAKLSAEKEWIGKEMPEPQQGGLGEIREVVQKELQKMRYEVFCDIAYFDQWAVRPVGVSRWGHCYHLPSKEEAEGLAKQLEELERERDEAIKKIQRQAERIRVLEGATNHAGGLYK